MLIAALYWPRANTRGAICALVMGAIGPVTFLLLGKDYNIAPEVAGGAAFGLAAVGMIVGSLSDRRPRPTATANA